MALERRAHTRPSPAVGEAREGREPGGLGGEGEAEGERGRGGSPLSPPASPTALRPLPGPLPTPRTLRRDE